MPHQKRGELGSGPDWRGFHGISVVDQFSDDVRKDGRAGGETAPLVCHQNFGEVTWEAGCRLKHGGWIGLQ